MSSQQDHSKSSDIWLETTIKFNRISVKEIEEDQVVYYQMITSRHLSHHYGKDSVAHGPFIFKEIKIVNEKEYVTLINQGGVQLHLSPENLQFLKIDLISLITGK